MMEQEIKIYAPTEEGEKITVKIVDKEVYINNEGHCFK